MSSVEDEKPVEPTPWDVAREAVLQTVADRRLTAADVRRLDMRGVVDLFGVAEKMPEWFEWEPEMRRLAILLESAELETEAEATRVKIETALKTDPTLADIAASVAVEAKPDGKMEVSFDRVRA